MEDRGKEAWDRVEAFRLKHGHLPDKSAAPCPECFKERTDALIELQKLKAAFELDDTSKFDPADALHRMQNICRAIQSQLPERHRFMVFILPETWPGEENNPQKRAHYAGNLDRPTALTSVKEWLVRNGQGEDWMKHIL